MSVKHGASRTSSAVAAAGLALIWTQLGSKSHEKTLAVLTVVFVTLCLVSLIVYGYELGTRVFDQEVSTRRCESHTVKIIGGFWLTREAAEVRRERQLTVQELLKGAAYDPDKVWPRGSREMAKQVLVLSYVGLTMCGTLALSCAAILVIL